MYESRLESTNRGWKVRIAAGKYESRLEAAPTIGWRNSVVGWVATLAESLAAMQNDAY